MTAKLLDEIARWRQDDTAGYDTAIQLLCAAETALQAVVSDEDKLEALCCAYRAGAADFGAKRSIDSAAEIDRARALLGLPALTKPS